MQSPVIIVGIRTPRVGHNDLSTSSTRDGVAYMAHLIASGDRGPPRASNRPRQVARLPPTTTT